MLHREITKTESFFSQNTHRKHRLDWANIIEEGVVEEGSLVGWNRRNMLLVCCWLEVFDSFLEMLEALILSINNKGTGPS